MSDASPVNGAAPKVRKAAAKVARAAPKVARKTASKVASKVKAEARSFAADADDARDKLVATAIHRARARREVARRWTMDQAKVASQGVKMRPVTAIGAALGVGVIIGLLLAG
jgi:ElaB/YqjD/DUF883 family membrane-anchored ribosome-binding protein